MRKPFYWKARKAWHVKDRRGRNVRLHEDQDEAYRIWGELLQREERELCVEAAENIANLYLRSARKSIAATTYEGYARYLVDFCNEHGRKLVRHLKPFHMTQWLDSRLTWGNSSRRHAIAVVKRCFNWAVAEGLIVSNPFARVPRPAAARRETLVSDEQHMAMVGACERHFRPVLILLRHTGMRPGGIGKITSESVSSDVSAIVFQQHKTRRKTGKPLVVYLSPCAATLVRIAMRAAESSDAPLFKMRNGRAWTVNAMRCRMARLREKLGLPAGTCLYSYRHSFATRAIVKGVDVATVAELLGHRDTKMVSQVYGHLAAMQQHLKEAAKRAVS